MTDVTQTDLWSHDQELMAHIGRGAVIALSDQNEIIEGNILAVDAQAVKFEIHSNTDRPFPMILFKAALRFITLRDATYG